MSLIEIGSDSDYLIQLRYNLKTQPARPGPPVSGFAVSPGTFALILPAEKTGTICRENSVKKMREISRNFHGNMFQYSAGKFREK